MKLHSLRKDVKRGLLYTAGSLAEQSGQFEWNASRIMHAFTYLLSSQQQSRLATRHSLARLGSDSYHLGKAAKMTESWWTLPPWGGVAVGITVTGVGVAEPHAPAKTEMSSIAMSPLKPFPRTPSMTV